MSQAISKIDEIRQAMPTEAAELLDQLVETRHPNGKYVVSAPALAQLLRSTCRTDISESAVKRYRSKVTV